MDGGPGERPGRPPAAGEDVDAADESGSGSLAALFGRPVFRVGEDTYGWEDVVLAAVLWSDWAALEEEVRRGLACGRRAEETGEEPSDEEVEAAAADFRYAHDLVAAEEMEAWLEERGLDVEGWMGYVRRGLLKGRWADELAEIASAYAVGDEELAGSILAEGLCSGELTRLSRKLAGRAAVYGETLRETPSPLAGDSDDGARSRIADGSGEGELEALVEAWPREIRESGLAGLGPEACREKLERLARLEVAYRRFCERAATPKGIADQLGSHQLDWVRLHCRTLAFPDEQMAREAALCLREDARELAEVAADAKRHVRAERFYLEELDAGLRGAFLGARSGELLGPVERRGEFVLFLVSDKCLPSEDDPEVRRRAEARLLEGMLDRQVAQHVGWLNPL